MAKKLFFMIIAVMSFMAASAQQNLPLRTERVKTGTVYTPIPRTPINPPTVGMDDNTLYFETDHPAFTLVLLDEEGEEAYVVNIPSSVESIVLPSTLSGIYELQIYDGSGYYYYCEIEL